LNLWVTNYGDWQFGIYLDGLNGKRPALPMSYAELERQAEGAMSADIWSSVAGGAGDERTQRANARAFEGWGLMPRMLAAATERDVSVELFGRRLATPLLLAPVGVIGLCAGDMHGDLACASAAAAMGVPMVASTLAQDPMEAVAAEFGDPPRMVPALPARRPGAMPEAWPCRRKRICKRPPASGRCCSAISGCHGTTCPGCGH
jgi:hypothetical protein